MANYPVLSVLPVGQGNCNLIEVYSDPSYTKLIFLGMVDCGAVNTYKIREIDGYVLNDNIVQAYDYIWGKMQQRGTTCSPTRPYYLDVLLITHQDMDHWVLLQELFQYKVGKKITYANGNILYSQYTGKDTSFRYYLEKQQTQNKWIYSERNCFCGVYYYLEVSVTEADGIVLNKNVIVQQYLPNSEEKYKYYWSSSKEDKIKYTVESVLIKSKQVQEHNFDSFDKSKLPPVFLEYKSKDNSCIMENIQKKLDTNVIIETCIGDAYIGGINYDNTFNDFLSAFNRDQPHYYLNLLSDNCFYLSNLSDLSHENSNIKIYSVGNSSLSIDFLCCLNETTIDTMDYFLRGALYEEHRTGQNASSAVTCWTIERNNYLFTGDATVHTMFYINEALIEDVLPYYQGAVMTAPHHGSVTTSKGKSDSNCSDDYQVLGDFLTNLAPQAIVIGAGYNNSYHIPGKAFIDKSLIALKDKIDVDHYVYYYINSNDYILKTNQNIFSTVQAVEIFGTYAVVNTQHTFKGLSHSHYLYDKILGYFDAYTTI